MRSLVIIIGLAACVAGAQVKLIDGITPKVFPPVEFKEAHLLNWIELKKIALEHGGEVTAGHIEADVTDYVIKIMKNLQNVIVQLGLDPMGLSNQTIKLIPTGKLDIYDGWLSDLSTINISDSVLVRYTQETDILDLTLPLAFKSLLITYDYHVKIVLLSIKGTIDAKIKQVKCNLRLGFNLTSYHAFVDDVDITDSGTITFKFTGLGLLDWIINLLTGVLTTLFHSIILGVINAVIYVPVNSIVDVINTAIDNVFHNNSTSLI
ncbi:uncharacterized protein LOC126745389 [Anthonomus grandis grandis]|uniref:uncharacterized protein LOC126745389 n=1 Tax=Anthonomus grandis grandis TaxID=2921223 RepID=UPI002164F207|nr:uncharacterized protein LOC126745389 [Anthonomus grandis grandis]